MRATGALDMGRERSGRPTFLRLLTIFFSLAALANGFPAVAQMPPAAAFATLPAMDSPALSADGTRLAFITHSAEDDLIFVSDLGTMAVTTVVDTGQSRPQSVNWASDDALFFAVGAPTGLVFVASQGESASPFGVDLTNEASVTRLLQDRGARARSGGGGRFGGGLNAAGAARLIGYDRASGSLLYPKFDFAAGERVLYAVDPKNDRQRPVDRGARSTIGWVVDESGKAVYRVDATDRPNRFVLLGHPGARWEVLVEETGPLPQLSLHGLDDAGRIIVGAIPQGRDTLGLYVLSPETGELGEAVLTDERYDVSTVRIDPYTNRVVGASAGDGPPVWFDAELADHQGLVDEAFPGEFPVIVSWSEQRERMIVRTESGNRPPAYYVYDTVAPSIDQIATAYAGLQGVDLPPRREFSYEAEDGTTIPAYLTRPLGASGPTPAVLLPHGGPAMRDEPGFDWLAHFLATRGYTVLQPNFRGSAGLGRAWAMAGSGGWGKGVMQSDLSDGVTALVEQGLADPERICIVGASYGGYAALAGAAFTPGRYRCAAAIAGVADLVEMLTYVRETRGARNPAVGFWRQAVGAGPDEDAQARLREASPVAHVESIRAPILLIHARDDAVVPLAQSRAMEEALTRAGKEVELVELDGQDHWLAAASTRLAVLRALEQFLAGHLAGR